MKWTIYVVVGVVVSGCSGHVVTMSKNAACKTKEDGNVCEGVPYRMSIPALTEVSLVRTVDAEGNTVLSADAKDDAKKCVPVKAVLAKAKASSTVRYVSYKPGFLEFANFDVSLTSDGTISKVGTVSSSAAKDTADAVSSLVAAYVSARSAGMKSSSIDFGTPKDCNAEAEDDQSL